MKGILTSCISGKELEVELDYEIKNIDGRRVFLLIGGPTGWESFYIDSQFTNIKAMTEIGWLACAGTKNQWDRLYISADEMKKIFDKENIDINNNMK